MISSLHRNEVTVRLSSYLPEMRLLYKRGGLPAPSNAAKDSGALSFLEQSPLREELSALLRSVVYREQEQVTEDDLAELLLCSLADEPVNLRSEDLEDARQRVRELLRTALRSFWRSAPDAPYRSRLSKQPVQGAEGAAQEVLPTPSDAHLSADSTAANYATEQRSTPSDGARQALPLQAKNVELATLPGPSAPDSGNLTHREIDSTEGKRGTSVVANAHGLPELFPPAVIVDPKFPGNIAANQEAVAREVARMLAKDEASRREPRFDERPSSPPRRIEEVRLAGELDVTPPRTTLSHRQPAPLPPATAAQTFSDMEHTQSRARAGSTGRSAVREGDLERVPLGAAERSVGNASALTSPVRLHTRQPGEQGPSAEDEEGVFPEYRALPFIRPEHRLLWIVGLCCLLLGLAAGLLARGRHATQDTPITQPGAAPSPTSQVKPSPYVLPSPIPMPSSERSVTAPSRVARAGDAVPSRSSAVGDAADDGTSVATGGASTLPVRVEGRSTAQAPTARGSAPEPEPLTLDARSSGSSLVPSTGSPSSERLAASGSESPAGSVYLSSTGVMASNLVAAPAPAYPAQASAAGVQGRVVVQALVGRDGHVLDAHVTSGDRMLREASLEAVTRWRYRPFVQAGRPAEVETVAILDFRLEP